LLAGTVGASAAAFAVPAFAVASSGLTDAERRTLIMAAQMLFPHPLLSEAPYRQIVVASYAQGDAAAGARAGLAQLEAGGEPWGQRSEAGRRAALAAVLPAPFFQGLRFTVLIGLYANLQVTSRFGYQGPSLEEGGYLERGFDALPWLPAPVGGEASRWPI